MLTIATRFLIGIALLCCFEETAFSQNLLANGSFEEENICAEYGKNCAPEAWICSSLTSNYYFDIGEWAYDGKHMVGLIAGNEYYSTARSFIRSRLLCGLRKGHAYKVQFHARSQHAVFDSLGVYFSPTDFLFDKRPYKQIVPSLVLSETMIAGDTAGWKNISFIYTAGGDENFITIGNFKRLEYKFINPPEIKGSYYIYIDSVSCTALDPHEFICAGADSMKASLYEENERHILLEKKTAYYRKNPPVLSRPSVTILQHIDTLVIPDILFATGSAKLHENSWRVLDSFCVSLAGKQIDSLVVEGHTDSVGKYGYNKKLSADRAKAVSMYIGGKSGIEQNRIYLRHFAYSKPVASNATATGRQRNRRVEIYLFMHE